METNPNFDIILFSDSINPDSYPFAEKNIEFRSIDPSLLGNVPVTDSLPIASYLRLLIPFSLRGEYDRFIYLDGDTFMLAPGIQELFNIDMEGKFIAAAPDALMLTKRLRRRHREYLKNIGITDRRYMNSGLILFDVEKYCASGLLDKVIEFALENSSFLTFADQSALNGVIKGDWLQLSVKWNWQTRASGQRLLNQFNVKNLHFTGPNKAWFPNNNPVFRRVWDHYDQFLSKEFPEYAEKNRSLPSRKYGWRRKIKGYLRDRLSENTLKQVEKNAVA